ncbi:MAG: ABC transporter permease subunit [Eubacteriales bacterium]
MWYRRVTAETLSVIHSIVYGLFGMLFFVTEAQWGYSCMPSLLAITILPLICGPRSQASIAVPDSYREGSFGLGAGKFGTVFQAVLPSAIPGILAGAIPGIGRKMATGGATYTLRTVAKYAERWSGRTLALHMYVLTSQGH